MLTTINLPKYLTQIGDHVFEACTGLSEITFPDSIKSIGIAAFSGCKSLQSIVFPKNLVKIGSFAFSGCSNLTSITLGDNIKSISDAFKGCDSLSEININSLKMWCSLTFLFKQHNPLSICKKLYYKGNLVRDLVIPDGTTTIGEHVFCDYPFLNSVSIPHSVKSIADNSFVGCDSLSAITVNCSELGLTFSGMTSIKNVYLGDSIYRIAKNAFLDCSNIEKVNIANLKSFCGIRFANPYANPLYYAHRLYSENNEIINLVIPSEVTTIGAFQFMNAEHLKSVTVPSSVTEIQSYSFAGCSSIDEVHITDLDAWCRILWGSEKANPLESFGELYLNGELVTEVRFPDNISNVGNSFINCKHLKKITLPKNVTFIDNKAFNGCDSLITIYSIPIMPPVLSKTTFSDYTATLYVPIGSKSAYHTPQNPETFAWTCFDNIVEFQPDTLGIPPVTLTANSYSIEYGDEIPAFGYTSEGADVDGKPQISCEAGVGSSVGTYDVVISKGTVKNYNDHYVNGTLTITKAPLVASVGDYSREEGQDNPAFVVNYEGWKLGETESVLITSPIATTAATKESPVGDYPITVSGGEAQNYKLEYINGTLTVLEASGINDVFSYGCIFDIYTTTGTKIKSHTTTLDGLPKGAYIINKKKVFVK